MKHDPYDPRPGAPAWPGHYLSAYGIAVRHGFRGTEEEWLDSLRGVQGEPGEQGPKGDAGAAGSPGPKGDPGGTGPQGPKGDKGDAGPQGPKGDPGADGSSFVVRGRYDTLDALRAAHPAGAAGDAYAVGTAQANTVYLWDVDAQDWADVGSIRGPQGDTGEPGPQGAKGDPGGTGPQGPKGDTGDAGPQGPKGDAGEPGPQGPTGDPGEPGPKGDPGPGLPAGGTPGQVPVKASGTDYETQWADPVGRSMAGRSIRMADNSTVTAGLGAEVFNIYDVFQSGFASSGNAATGEYSHAEGYFTTASGNNSHAEGNYTIASGNNSHAEGLFTAARASYAHAEGYFTTASGQNAHAEGSQTTASGDHSHAEGYSTTAAEANSHAEGYSTTASAQYAHAEGVETTASGLCSHAGGSGTLAEGAVAQTAIGEYNVPSSLQSDRFIIGKGTDNDNRANCFRVTSTGVYASGNYATSGADYAELFEWLDGNPDHEDRVGRFVTLSGGKIRLAQPEDDFILGVVSGNPSVLGDVHDDQWRGMYLYDIFDRPLWEDVEVPARTAQVPDPAHPGQTVAQVVIPAHTERRQKLNPDYDSAQTYIPRTQRPEWAAVGMMGKLVVIDDGSCQADGWAAVGQDGTAAASAERTKYRVMERLDGAHVRILILS